MVDAPAKLLQFHGAAVCTVVFLRYVIALILLLSLFAWRGELAGSTTAISASTCSGGCCSQHPRFQIFTPFRNLPLALTVSINFGAPLISCALAPFILGEHVGPRRWAAVCVGFIGMLIVIRPGADSFHPAMFASLFNALMMSLYQLYTRKAGFTVHPEAGLLWVFAVGTLVAGVAVTGEGFSGPSPNWLWAVALLMGVSGLGAHVVMARGLQLAPASLLAPFAYTQLLWMTLSGILLFGDWPDHVSLIGAAVIIASGIYVWHRERVTGSAAVAATIVAD